MAPNYKELVLGEEFADLIREPSVQVGPKIDIEAHAVALIHNLNIQLKLYGAYVEQAERQRMALVNHKLAENAEVNVASERLIGYLADLERDRIAITQKMLPGKSAKELSVVKCEALYPLLGAENAKALKECRDALIKVTGTLRSLLNINTALVENGSRVIHTTIGIMTSVVGRTAGEKMNTYTSKGSVRVGKLQVRNLFNRSI
jgi:hypothetical protein